MTFFASLAISAESKAAASFPSDCCFRNQQAQGGQVINPAMVQFDSDNRRIFIFMITDTHGRKITYLRISVTDRCNLRCVYCMPDAGIIKQPHHAIMRYEEIIEVVRVFTGLGVNAIRITGGEPLVRPDLHRLIEMISAMPEITDISITTNGMLLEKQAASLASAGLKRVNISLDTIQPDKFKRITRFGSLEKIWRGIEAAEKHNLSPIKINVVAMRGVNEDEFTDLALLTMQHPWSVRFIELMPVGNQISWGDGFPTPGDAFISVSEIQEMLSPLGLSPVNSVVGSGPAKEYRLAGAKGKVGFISPLSEHFCGSCNRMRLTADGHLRPCLLSDLEIPLLPALREGKSLLPLIKHGIKIKPAGHHLDEDETPEKRKMKDIGG